GADGLTLNARIAPDGEAKWKLSAAIVIRSSLGAPWIACQDRPDYIELQGNPPCGPDSARIAATRERAAMTKRIGVLTSGGDCAGLNTAIRAVVARASGGYGWTVVGIRQGTAGLLARPAEHDILELDRLPAQLHRLGGTILGTTNKGDPFAFPY